MGMRRKWKQNRFQAYEDAYVERMILKPALRYSNGLPPKQVLMILHTIDAVTIAHTHKQNQLPVKPKDKIRSFIVHIRNSRFVITTARQ